MKKLKIFVRILVIAISFLLSSVLPHPGSANYALAAEQDQGGQVPGNENNNIDPEALAILKKATDYLTGLNQFRLNGHKEEDAVQESGQKLQFSASFEVYLKRPNRMFVSRMDDDGIMRRFWYDGKTAIQYDAGANVYAQTQVPDTIDGMLDYMETILESPPPLADLLYNDLSFLSERALSGVYIGISLVENTACDHLAFRGETVDWQMWVDRGEKPLMRKIVITYKELPGQPQISARLEEWNTQPEISDTLFQFSMPEGARRIKIIRSKRLGPQTGGAQ